MGTASESGRDRDALGASAVSCRRRAVGVGFLGLAAALVVMATAAAAEASAAAAPAAEVHHLRRWTNDVELNYQLACPGGEESDGWARGDWPMLYGEWVEAEARPGEPRIWPATGTLSTAHQRTIGRFAGVDKFGARLLKVVDFKTGNALEGEQARLRLALVSLSLPWTRGAFGEVVLASTGPEVFGGKLYAAKMMRSWEKPYAQTEPFTRRPNIFCKEIQLLNEYGDGIIAEIWVKEGDRDGQWAVFLVTPLRLGDVAGVRPDLIAHIAGLRFAHALRMLLDGGAQLAKMHDHGFIHRDWKAQNMLVGNPEEAAGAGDLDRWYWLADFGLGERLLELSARFADGRATQFAGTPKFLPMEMFDEGPQEPALDVYELVLAALDAAFGDTPINAYVNVRVEALDLDLGVPGARDAADKEAIVVALKARGKIIDRLGERDENGRKDCTKLNEITEENLYDVPSSIEGVEEREYYLVRRLLMDWKNYLIKVRNHSADLCGLAVVALDNDPTKRPTMANIVAFARRKWNGNEAFATTLRPHLIRKVEPLKAAFDGYRLTLDHAYTEVKAAAEAAAAAEAEAEAAAHPEGGEGPR